MFLSLLNRITNYYKLIIFVIYKMKNIIKMKKLSFQDIFFILFIISIIVIVYLCYDYFINKNKLKEGYYFKPGAKQLVSHSMTAKQCQQSCKSKPHCKFSYYSWATHYGGRGSCWNTVGSDSLQAPFGAKFKGGAAWRNKDYTPKPPTPPPKPKFRHGMYISLFNTYSKRYVAAETNGRIGQRGHRVTWETFQVLRHPDGKNWLLRSYHGGWLGFLPYRTTNHYGVRPIRHWPHYSVVFSAKGLTPTSGWSWQRIQFGKNKDGTWHIYNPTSRRYMNSHYNQKALGDTNVGGGEKFKIFEVVRGNWGRGSREWNDVEIK